MKKKMKEVFSRTLKENFVFFENFPSIFKNPGKS